MLKLPEKTILGQTMPKKMIYEQLDASAALKRRFVEQIERIVFQNRIAEDSVNIVPGVRVEEIDVFEIELRGQNLDEEIVRQIDKAIPRPILFLLKYEGLVQARISYKEIKIVPSKGTAKVNQIAFYKTEWVEPEKLPCKMVGFDLDAVYENFVLQVAGDALRRDASQTVAESVDSQKKRAKMQKRIDALENRIRKEPQFNRQMEMSDEIKRLKKELEELN